MGTADLAELTAEEVLAHYGVPGMKWGVRKNDPTSSGTQSEDSKKAAEAKAVIANTKGRGGAQTTAALSNKDLQTLVTRMNLEQQYDRLSTNEAKAAQSPAKAFVAKILLAEGKKQAESYAQDAVASNLNDAITKVKDKSKKDT